MTRVFDSAAGFAKGAVDGFVCANRSYATRVDGGVVRAMGTPAGQVALVIGSSSGHYPAFAGLVRACQASRAVFANVPASPAAGQVYKPAKVIEVGKGGLLFYGNDAGDALNFDQADARLNAEAIHPGPKATSFAPMKRDIDQYLAPHPKSNRISAIEERTS
ncbi:MAG: dihydroxyacetone kinase subunit DhaK [Acidimicrobiales bacterium]|jgi:dihydroxyacetone kinase